MEEKVKKIKDFVVGKREDITVIGCLVSCVVFGVMAGQKSCRSVTEAKTTVINDKGQTIETMYTKIIK